MYLKKSYASWSTGRLCGEFHLTGNVWTCEMTCDTLHFMEIACSRSDFGNLHVSTLPDILKFLRNILVRVRASANRLSLEHKRNVVIKERIKDMLDDLVPLFDCLPVIIKLFEVPPQTDSIRQLQLNIGFLLAYLLILLQMARNLVNYGNYLNRNLFKRLKKDIEQLSGAVDSIMNLMIERSDSPHIQPVKKYNIGEVSLAIPLQIFVDDDDTGKYVSCLELPQIYGFGETETEALEMLGREILALHEDVSKSENVANEFRYAAELISIALGNE